MNVKEITEFLYIGYQSYLVNRGPFKISYSKSIRSLGFCWRKCCDAQLRLCVERVKFAVVLPDLVFAEESSMQNCHFFANFAEF